jgi:hypothetical protein
MICGLICRAYGTMGIPEICFIDPQDGAYYRYEERQLLRNESSPTPPTATSSI